MGRDGAGGGGGQHYPFAPPPTFGQPTRCIEYTTSYSSKFQVSIIFTPPKISQT